MSIDEVNQAIDDGTATCADCGRLFSSEEAVQLIQDEPDEDGTSDWNPLCRKCADKFFGICKLPFLLYVDALEQLEKTLSQKYGYAPADFIIAAVTDVARLIEEGDGHCEYCMTGPLSWSDRPVIMPVIDIITGRPSGRTLCQFCANERIETGTFGLL